MPGLFDDHFVLEKLNKLKDPLERLDKYIDWRIFKQTLADCFESQPKDKSKGGRPAYDRLMLFKSCILQSLYNLSDEQLEYQIVDRASFKRFLGLRKSDRVPDSRTFWQFREALIEKGVIEALFECFNEQLDRMGILAHEGKMVDASFVEVPRQRNTREENQQVKVGQVPSSWQDNPNKLAQKDTDARWTKKNATNFYGYKNHVKADTGSKLIVKYLVTDASVHDSQALDALLDERDKGQEFYADSAYTGENAEKVYTKNEVTNKVHEKGYKNKPLTEGQRISNKAKSKIRARVEHIFGFVENSMNGSFIKTIGIKRAKAKIGLMNIVYNICRCVQLKTVVSMG
jgi:IS5 family transposase